MIQKDLNCSLEEEVYDWFWC